MSRTRGASQVFSGGELLGKHDEPLSVTPAYAAGIVPAIDRDGNPISPAAARLAGTPMRLSASVLLHGPGAEPVAPQPRIVGYRAEPKSWARDMDAHELARLIHLYLQKEPEDFFHGLVLDLTPEEWTALDGNMRRHFMAVREL